MEQWSRSLDLRALAESFGTPLYIHHLEALRKNFERYRTLVRDPGNVRYPIKANPSPVVVETLASLGSGADCASKHEIDIALGAGIPIERISYNSPAPEIDVAVWMLRVGATTVADSTEVFAEIKAAFGDDLFPGKLFVRVNPGGLPGYKEATDLQRFTSHASARSQFGIPSEELVDFLAGYSLPVSGLHTHVGTQMDNVGAFTASIRFLHRLADILAEETPHRIDTVNLGGGLGIPFLAGQAFPSIEELTAALRPYLRRKMRYEVEPGNSLVGEAVGLLARVVATKEARGRRWAVIDVGTDQMEKFTISRWEHQIVDADGQPLDREGPDGLCGPLCFAGDVFLPATRLAGIAKGDPLLVQHAGAYCEAVSSRFNGRRAPAHVVVDGDGRAELVRRSEDLFFEPSHQTLLPAGLAQPETFEGGETLDLERVAALQSEYMYELANHDRYTITEARRTGERSFLFRVQPAAAVSFVAMPLALRILGDTSIAAVGLLLGWERKDRPIWATRLSMTCGEMIPISGELLCAMVIGPLRPSRSPGIAATALVHYSLGRGEFSGVSRVVIPTAAELPVAVAGAGEEKAA